MTMESVLVANRFLHDASLVMLFGGGCFTQLVAPDLRGVLERVWVSRERAAIAIVAATTVVSLPLNVATFTESWPSTHQLTIYLLETNTGRVLLLEMFTAATLIGVSTYSMPKITVLVAGLMLSELALAGHVADGDNLRKIIASVVAILHILAGAAWLGALPILLTVLSCLRHNVHRHDGVAAMQKFSKIGHVVVALNLTCGIATAMIINGLPSPLTFYGRAVLLKTLLVFTMVVLAVINRYAIVPRITSHRGAGSLLIAGAAGEILLGMTALLVVASFGTIDPA